MLDVYSDYVSLYGELCSSMQGITHLTDTVTKDLKNKTILILYEASFFQDGDNVVRLVNSKNTGSLLHFLTCKVSSLVISNAMEYSDNSSSKLEMAQHQQLPSKQLADNPIG